MTNTDKLSLDEARKHLTSESQKSERPRLWENHMNNVVARARARVIDEKFDEEFNAWVQEFDPQVCSCCTTIYTKKSLLIGSQGRSRQAEHGQPLRGHGQVQAGPAPHQQQGEEAGLTNRAKIP